MTEKYRRTAKLKESYHSSSMQREDIVTAAVLFVVFCENIDSM